jgi:putative transposase
MEGIMPKLRRSEKRRLEKRSRNCRDAKTRVRYLIVLNLAEGQSPTDTAHALRVSRSTVYRIAERFLQWGEVGLVDRREENGQEKLTEEFLGNLYDLVGSSPQEHGWPRPTWTREMLIETMKQLIGIEVSEATMSRALKKIGARRGRPKPTVESTWSKTAKNKRLREIRELVDNLPDDEVVVYEDEVDIHLNPKIGLDWMLKGQQKEVLTPGQNKKRYLAGALNPATGELIWVEGEKKNSLLYILLLWELHLRYPQARRIHVIVDNYSIHFTEQVRQSLESETGHRFCIHPLPPYCPDHNKIERVWQDLHANVTRNHTCPDMPELMGNVHIYLQNRNNELQIEYALAS